MDKTVEMNANELVAYFRKPATELTKADIIAFVREKGIRMVDFMYPAEDGRVKTLNFMINNLAYLETILTDGERVDGSSLFPSFVEAESSDLYVVPRFRTAFVSPFSDVLRQGRASLRLFARADAAPRGRCVHRGHGHDLRGDGRA